MLKAPKETIIRKVASPKTYYAIAAIWVLGTLVLPMYKLSSYLILIPVAVSFTTTAMLLILVLGL